MYINQVGTFGGASASYYWSRAAGRLTQYLTRRSANTWHQLVADDFHLKASGTQYRAALISSFVLCSTAGVSFSWGKTAGGDKARVRAPQQHVPPGNLGMACGMVHQVGRRSRQLRHSQHNELRRRTGSLDGRRRDHWKTRGLFCRRYTPFSHSTPEEL